MDHIQCDSLECDFCGTYTDVIIIRFQTSDNDIREYNICRKPACYLTLFGEFKRFLLEVMNPELELNDISKYYKII